MTGVELKERRERLGLTQRQLAEMVGYTENYILMLENGHRDIKRPQILELALSSLENAQAVPVEKPKASRPKKKGIIHLTNPVNWSYNPSIEQRRFDQCSKTLSPTKT